MKVVFEPARYPLLQIRPESPMEDYALRKWYEDWTAGKATLQVSWKAGEDAEDGYETQNVVPKEPA